jgi:hypothetical protein
LLGTGGAAAGAGALAGGAADPVVAAAGSALAVIDARVNTALACKMRLVRFMRNPSCLRLGEGKRRFM